MSTKQNTNKKAGGSMPSPRPAKKAGNGKAVKVSAVKGKASAVKSEKVKPGAGVEFIDVAKIDPAFFQVVAFGSPADREERKKYLRLLGKVLMDAGTNGPIGYARRMYQAVDPRAEKYANMISSFFSAWCGLMDPAGMCWTGKEWVKAEDMPAANGCRCETDKDAFKRVASVDEAHEFRAVKECCNLPPAVARRLAFFDEDKGQWRKFSDGEIIADTLDLIAKRLGIIADELDVIANK